MPNGHHFLYICYIPAIPLSTCVRRAPEKHKSHPKTPLMRHLATLITTLLFAVNLFAASPLHGYAIETFPTDLLEIPAAIPDRSETVIRLPDHIENRVEATFDFSKW